MESIWIHLKNRQPQEGQMCWFYLPNCPFVELGKTDIWPSRYLDSDTLLFDNIRPYIIAWTPMREEYPQQPKYRCPCNLENYGWDEKDEL